MLSFCLFVFLQMGKAEWGGNPVCWWFGLYFCFVCCLGESSCIGFYWWFCDPGSCIQMVSFVWVLSIWYSLGLILGEDNGNPLGHSCLENPMDGEAWWAAAHGPAKSWTRLSDFTFTFHFHALQKEMVTHSSVLAWRIPGTGEPRGLPSMGSHRVRHDWSILAAAAAAGLILW